MGSFTENLRQVCLPALHISIRPSVYSTGESRSSEVGKAKRATRTLSILWLEQLATRIVLCATTEESVVAQLQQVRDAITSYREKSE